MADKFVPMTRLSAERARLSERTGRIDLVTLSPSQQELLADWWEGGDFQAPLASRKATLLALQRLEICGEPVRVRVGRWTSPMEPLGRDAAMRCAQERADA